MSYRFCRRSLQSLESSDNTELAKLWILRLLVPLGAHRKFIHQNEFEDDTLARFLGLDEWIDDVKLKFKQKAVRAHLQKLYNEAERSLRHAESPKSLAANISRLSHLVGLSEADRRIIEFAVFIHSEGLLDVTADYLGHISTADVHNVLSVLLDISEPNIRTALSSKGVLASSGLVRVDRDGTGDLRNKLNLLSSNFADTMLYSDADPVTLLRDIIVPSKSATLKIDDFGHIKPSLKLLLLYLQEVLATARKGVNILLYGPPGTGKSELSRLLAKTMECELFEVASEDDDGDPVDGDRRLRAFSAAQSLFSQRRQALILFDEVEDVFDKGMSFFAPKRSAISHKGWINRVLEGNMVPTIWVSNSVDCLDRAFIRRFDMVFELPIPPKPQREQIVRAACEGMMPAELVRKIAESENLAPAVITRTMSVIKCIKGELGEKDIPDAIERLIGNTLKAQGHRPLKRNDADRLPKTYDPTFINADTDLVVVATGLERTKSGRLCLYGPPGTGKTAFGRWLAERLEIPLCVKKGSDLLSMWVGGTEQNIAEAFREAEQDGALLLIDEVDSFLQDRRRAQSSWEVTGVNEMLTQMESFPGVFIASTNLMNGLDQAALRRFDLKLKFDFLKPKQAWLLFKRHCTDLGLPVPKPQLKVEITKLSLLTSGDFAAVARQNRFRPIGTPSAFISALEQECLVKEDGQRKAIGFF